ncbi:MAG: hypothetical protein H6841_00385 [Planctomycetes bacterium]|nr:hypothetical protein [Planctomycetota bacterium]MCB9935845.1 hypothetical protein [Planctomycetota bacterium]
MKNISMFELEQALNEGRVAALFDNRGPGSYGALHIKGARQLSVSEVKDNLPDDVNAMLVFY